MKPLDFQKTIENQFDYICKRAIQDEVKDYYKYISRLSSHETTFSDLGNASEYLVNQFSSVDFYPSDYCIFKLNGCTVNIENDLLGEAVRNLPDNKQKIILMYYLLGMNDSQIAEILKLNRSTVYRHRMKGLEIIKKFMEDNPE